MKRDNKSEIYYTNPVIIAKLRQNSIQAKLRKTQTTRVYKLSHLHCPPRNKIQKMRSKGQHLVKLSL